MTKSNKIIFGGILLLLIHLPFITSDPFIPLDDSRGGYTDEGLYLFQTAIFWKTGILSLQNADGFLKTPFYNLLLFPMQGIANLWGIRFCCLLFFAFTFIKTLHTFKFTNYLIPVAAIVLLMQPTVFMHVHLAMAEVFVIGFILLSAISFHKNSSSIWPILFLAAAVASKIQYTYLLLLVPPLIVFQFKEKRWKNLVFIALLGVCCSVFLTLFLKDYQYIIGSQQAGKFQDFGNWLLRMRYNFTHLLTYKINIVIILGVASSVIYLFIYHLKNRSMPSKLFLFILAAWLLESHKFIYIYLPQRYLVLWFVLSIILILIALNTFLKPVKLNTKAIWVMTLLFLLFGTFQYMELYKNRQFEREALSQKFAKYLPKDATVIGPWAPSLCFNLPVSAATAWGGYYENIKDWNKPGVFIITEKDQGDVDSLFVKKLAENLVLHPVAQGKIRHWEIELFEVKLKTPTI